MYGLKPVPFNAWVGEQGLKPFILRDRFGTTRAVPCYKA